MIGGVQSCERFRKSRVASICIPRDTKRFVRRGRACRCRSRTAAAPRESRIRAQPSHRHRAPAATDACAYGYRDGSGEYPPSTILRTCAASLFVDRDLAPHHAPHQFRQSRGQVREADRARFAPAPAPDGSRHRATASRAPAHGVFERVAVGHQSGRGQDSVPVRFDDPGVHIASEAEIIGIDNQPDRALASLRKSPA